MDLCRCFRVPRLHLRLIGLTIPASQDIIPESRSAHLEIDLKAAMTHETSNGMA